MPKQTIGSIDVHTFPLPPKGFDPITASPQDLERHGFPRRPDPAKLPVAAARWIREFSRYREFNHIAPEFKALERRHGPNKRTAENTKGNVNATSYNWSGSVLFIGGGEKFSWIFGTWTVPHVYPVPTQPGVGYSSAWLGIDGDGSPDVMQAGTETDSDGTCYAWFEWFPAFSIAINNLAVSPGDVIYLILCATSATNAWLSMANMTSKQYTSFSFSAPKGTVLVGNCAEAVVERPSIGNTLAELPRYGDVFFDDTMAVTNSANGYSIGLGTALSMVGDDGVSVISTPTFEADTDAFKVAYTGP